MYSIVFFLISQAGINANCLFSYYILKTQPP